MTAKVSVDVPDELKAELDAENVNTDDVIREALETELSERRRDRIREQVTEIRRKQIPTDDVVEFVREDRGYTECLNGCNSG